MKILQTVRDWAVEINKLMATLFGLGIMVEIMFGQFLGDYSIIESVAGVVEMLGDKGFAGLIAMLVLLHFTMKDK
jgi:hypothetical protein